LQYFQGKADCLKGSMWKFRNVDHFSQSEWSIYFGHGTWQREATKMSVVVYKMLALQTSYKTKC
jgi:hypothetical protein